MTTYQAEYTPLFEKNLKRYRSMRQQIRRKIGGVLQDPYAGTERLGKAPAERICVAVAASASRATSVSSSWSARSAVASPHASSASAKGCLMRPSSS